jgi:hypothetical protein
MKHITKLVPCDGEAGTPFLVQMTPEKRHHKILHDIAFLQMAMLVLAIICKRTKFFKAGPELLIAYFYDLNAISNTYILLALSSE